MVGVLGAVGADVVDRVRSESVAMTGRILLGERSPGRVGLYVSRPGAEVTTCPDGDLLIDTDKKSVRVIWQQVYDLPVLSINSYYFWRINHPNFGYTPIAGIEVLSGYTTSTVVSVSYPQPNVAPLVMDATPTSFCVQRVWTGSGSPYVFPAVRFVARLWNLIDPAPYPAWSNLYGRIDI
jgi:hypothetical protein